MRKITQVTTFRDYKMTALEREINEFLDENDIEEADIRYSTCWDENDGQDFSGDVVHYAIVMYKVEKEDR